MSTAAHEIAVADQVSSLVRLALEQKVPVEVLERLVALQERVTIRNARVAFFDAFAAFQQECPQIKKTKTATVATRSGGSFGYSYAPLDEITRVIQPILTKHGFSFSWTVKPGSGYLDVTCILRHIEAHEESSSFPVPIETSAAMSGAQKNGSALTYGRRQSLVAVLGLTTADQDIDGITGETTETGELITPEQVADLDALIDEVGANKEKFLKWLGTDSLEKIHKSAVPAAIRALEEKRK